MILCDIGNTHYHFFESGRLWRVPVGSKPDLRVGSGKIFVISVNDAALHRLANFYPVVDLAPYVDLDTEYRGLGIDRAVACLAINDGVIVDAGSAITVDVVQGGVHLGGYILPGFQKYQQMYSAISPKLKKAINFGVNMEALPQNTADAISYGVIAPIVQIIKETSRHKPIFFTGGDGPFLARHFDGAMVDNTLIFKGMSKIIKEMG